MKKVFIGCLGVFLIGSLAFLGYYFINNNKKESQASVSETPFRTDIIKKTVATGSIVPRKEIQIKPAVSGIISELYVEPGEIVKKGQRLAKVKLIPTPTSLNNAQSSYELAKIRLKEAERELSRQKRVFNEKVDVAEAQVNFDQADIEDKRQAELFEQGVISLREYQQAQQAREVAKTILDNTKISASNNLKAFETDVDIARQERDAAYDNLQLLKEGASKRSGQISNIITSTVNGMILEVPIEEGSSVVERNNFNEGTNIATIADMNSLIFEGTVDESDVGKLKENMALVLTVGALPNEEFSAILEFISPKGNEEEGSVKFEVKAAVQQRDDIFLRAGYSANGDIILEKKEDVWAIQERDIQYEEEKAFVEVEIGDQQYEKKEVELGISDGINVELINGIDTLTKIRANKKEM
ncbi:MAG: HlyD family efflux transporter periplasmic adaptor subunit [Bacteroidota bacterium]